MRIVALFALFAALGAAPSHAAYRVVMDEDGLMRLAVQPDAGEPVALPSPAIPSALAGSAAEAPVPVRSPRRQAVASAASSHAAAPAAADAAKGGGFADALGASVETSPGLKATVARSNAADAGVWREWSGLLPAIDLAGRYSHTNSSTSSNGELGYGGLSVSLAVFDAAAWNRVRGSQSQARAIWARSVSARDSVLTATAGAWLRGAYANEAAKEYRVSVARLEKLRRSVQAREGSGFASTADVNAVDARIASLKRELATFDEIRSKSGAEIASYTGGAVQLSGDLPPDSAIDRHGDSELAQLAIARSPALESARHAQDAAYFDSEAAKSEYLPKVRVSGDYNSGGAFGKGPGGDDLTVGVRLSIPLFRPDYVASVAETKELAEAARWEAEDVQQRVALQIETLLRERAAAAEKRKQIAAETAETANLVNSLEARYREGFGSIDELLNQQVALARARAQAVEVRTQQLYTVFQLMVLAGLADDFR